MNFNKVIEIDIWSNFGCFSKPFSTTGGLLTYLIPPKTSIIGIIGSVLGYEFDDFEKTSDNKNKYSIEELHDVKISLQPLFDLKTKRVTFNNVEGTANKPKIANIHQDVLVNPYYKLFISFPDSLSDVEETFIERIKSHQTVFSPYMGKNEFVLSYELCDIFDYESARVDSKNIGEFSKDGMKIYGTLNREVIEKTESGSGYENKLLENSLIFDFNKKGEKTLASSFEYIIPEYPVKRSNFTEFKFCEISFLAGKEFKENYFSKIYFKENIEDDDFLELVKIGGNEWISMI